MYILSTEFGHSIYNYMHMSMVCVHLLFLKIGIRIYSWNFLSEEHMKSAEYRKPQLTVDTDYLRWNPQTKRNRTSSHKKH